MQLEGKVALVTGAGSGIGAAIARRMAMEGAKVCIVARRGNTLEEVSGEHPPDRVKIFPGDVSKADDIKRMVRETVEWGGKLDVLVNCAAINLEGSVTSIELEDWHRIIDTNLHGPFLLMRETIPHMKKNCGGSIINISSVGGLRCLTERVGYCTSKAALIMLTQQAARDFGQFNIRCNAVCPGFVLTPMTQGHFGEFGETSARHFRHMPLKRGALPDEISGICVFLAGDDSSNITGAAIPIDGGNTVVDAFEASLS